MLVGGCEGGRKMEMRIKGWGVPETEEDEDERGGGRKTSFSVTICSSNKFRDFYGLLSQ